MQRFYIMSFVVALTSLWFIYDIGYRGIVLAAYRNRLFQLRFELFKLAAEHSIPFDSHLYRSLELLFNGLVRYAHTVSYLSYRQTVRDSPDIGKDVDFQRTLMDIEALPEETRQKVWAVLSDTRSALARYMATTSPIFFVIASYISLENAVRSIASPKKSTYVEVLEIEAYRTEKRRAIRTPRVEGMAAA